MDNVITSKSGQVTNEARAFPSTLPDVIVGQNTSIKYRFVSSRSHLIHLHQKLLSTAFGNEASFMPNLLFLQQMYRT